LNKKTVRVIVFVQFRLRLDYFWLFEGHSQPGSQPGRILFFNCGSQGNGGRKKPPKEIGYAT
jgi:hypothetical protein